MGFFSKLFGQAADNKQSKREFTEQLAQEIQQTVPDARVEVRDADDDAEISIHIEYPNAETNIVYPDNLYASYSQEREDFAAYKQNILNNIYDYYYGEEEVATLMPNIKHIDWVEEVERVAAQGKDDTPPQRLVTFPFAGDLVTVLALDYPNKMAYVFETDLAEHTPDGSKDTALQMALDNLRAYTEHISVETLEDTWHRISLDQTYDASLALILADILPQLALTAEPVLALIARDQFIVVDGNATRDIEVLQQYAAEQVRQVPHALSAHLYRYRDGHISVDESLQ